MILNDSIFVIFIFVLLFTLNQNMLYANKISQRTERNQKSQGIKYPLLDKFDDDNGISSNSNLKLYNSSVRDNSTNVVNLSNKIALDRKKTLEDKIRKVLTYGTYQDQAKMISRLGNNCKQETTKDGLDLAVAFLEEEGLFNDPFEYDSDLVLALINIVKNCNLYDKRSLIQKVLTEETKYPNRVKTEMKAKAFSMINKFYNQIDENEKENYSKMIEQYYRYERFHQNNLRIKMEVLLAAGKYRPKDFNKYLKREYSKEKNIDLKNRAIEIIGLYQDKDDIDFLHQIIKDEEAGSSQRWVAVVAFTNYAPNPVALLKVKEYAKMSLPEIASRAYYVLSFYDVDLDFFLEASKNNDEGIRLQAVQAFSRFSLEDVEEVLEYKSTKDSNASVRKAAKRILEKKKTAP